VLDPLDKIYHVIANAATKAVEVIGVNHQAQALIVAEGQHVCQLVLPLGEPDKKYFFLSFAASFKIPSSVSMKPLTYRSNSYLEIAPRFFSR